ncbi:MAG: leucine--tRNA ligase [Candidatus Pacearchaeota archaeon]
MTEINFKEIEKKWQDAWEREKIFEVSEKSKKPKYYVLEMFPYPSGSGLHMGHAWNYTIGDIIARFKIMNGYNVLHPMGYDALGLPAENAAIKVGIHPKDYTDKSITNFVKQQKAIGLSYDWSRTLSSADPFFYRWDQWIFLKMFEKGLAYQKTSAVNWCPKCESVLANEQVVNGKCWIHDKTDVEIKHLKQWYLKITDYADELYEEIDNLNWPARTKAMQKNWIGKSHGTEIEFEIVNPEEIKNSEFVFFHAYKDNSKSVFWPWLTKKIEENGGKVCFAPDLPNPSEPNIEEQVEFVIKKYNFNERSIIVTHSLGGVLALKLLSKLKTKIKKLILVATPSMSKAKDGKSRPAIDNCCDWKFNFEEVKKHAEEIIVLIDEKDHLLRVEMGREIADKLSAKLITTIAKSPHFNSIEEPEILQACLSKKPWSIFTTRPDTIFGVTFVVVSAQHTRLNELVTKEQKKDVDAFLKKIGGVSQKTMKEVEDLDKEGVFTGSYAINPATGEKVPVYAGNFVVADYGSGMVMAVPAHDQRDFEFAKKYGIPINQVIAPPAPKDELVADQIYNKKEAYTGAGELVDSETNEISFNGIPTEEALVKIPDWLISKGVARKVVNFRLRDWLISRQRYWGTPIPVIHCEKCGVVPVPEKDLPIELPKDVKFGKGNPLETNEKWVNAKCPKCGGDAKRETDTMDTFVNSSWYFMRYCDPKNNKKIFDSDKVKYWCPIDTYIGGAEHACMHLIYVRFYTKFLADLGLIDFREPAKRLFHQGMLRAEGGEKMSKSKGNVVLPEVVSDKYGIDTARFFMSGLASPDKDIDWDENGINGSMRFVKRLFGYFENLKFIEDSNELKIKLNKTIKNITIYYENFEYRKATIEIRELFDLIEKNGASKDSLEKFLEILNPICPHITEELWSKLGNKNFISNSEWPKPAEIKIKQKESKEDLNKKIIEDIRYQLGKTNETPREVFVYIMPFEIAQVDAKKISKELGKNVKVYAVNDSEKHDPENHSKRAKPGKAGIYWE